MNRSAICIKMLMLLKARGKMNTLELAKELETNPRNIREFKKELVTAGYNIQEVKGRYGGYYLDEDCLFPSLKLTKDEIDALNESRGIVDSHPEFVGRDFFHSGLDKVLCADKDTKSMMHYYVNQTGLALSLQEYNMVQTVQLAMDRKQSVEISYQTLSQKDVSTFLLDPYEIIHYKNAYYVIGFSHKRNEYRTYRFSIQRMKQCKLTDKRFLRDSSFNVASFIGKESLIKASFIRFEILVKTEFIRMFKEQYWGLDFKEIKKNDGILCTFMAEDPNKIYQQLFLFQDKAKLIAPLENTNEYCRMVKDILHMYQE
jgi:predicted DNA-binding transcriptional regulator YafY